MISPRVQAALRMIEAGRLVEARASLSRILRQEPGNLNANLGMLHILMHAGEFRGALEHGERALAVSPRDPTLRTNLAHVRLNLGDLPGAMEHYERVLGIDAMHLSARVGATDVLLRMFRYGEALRRAEEGLRMHPHDPRLTANRASALLQMGRGREAMAAYAEGVKRYPGDVTLATGLAGSMNYIDGVDPAERLAAHKRVGRLVALANGSAALPEAAHPSGPDRPLRIGVLSADFRAHAVSHFLEPWFHLPAGMEAHCYSTAGVTDATGERFRSMAASWREVAALPPLELARQIRRDGIDILVEMTGHTVGNRLAAVALRPAPVQITAVGYPATTGVPGVGWRLVDSLTDPPGEADAHATERLLRVDPCFLCYRAPEGAPEVRGREGGGVVFGSFSALAKLDETTARLWARVLEAAPGSRLYCKALAMKEPEVREAVMRRLVEAGADASRVELAPPREGMREHLEAYGRIDVALDTFPYHGTTTTCEALFMGVPVVTLAGRVSAARVGVSLLGAVGLADLVAGDADEYVRIAAALGADAGRREALRRGLRGRMLASALCDVEGYATRLGAALRDVWRRACAEG